MVKTLNDEFDEYRDLLRIVWNSSLRRRANGADSYDEISGALLKAVVLEALSNPKGAGAVRNEDGYVPGLGVSISGDKPEILSPSETDEEVVWNRLDAPPGNEHVWYFADVFDFRDPDGMRDLDFVKAISLGALGTASNATIVAVRRSDVDIVDLTAGR